MTPYVPVPETNGDEWDKLEPMVSLDALIELVVLGEYQGIGQEEGTKQKIKEALLLRTAGATVFEVCSLVHICNLFSDHQHSELYPKRGS